MKSILLSGEWIIKAPLKRVYKIVTDFERAPEFFPLVAQSLTITSKTENHLSIRAVTKTFGISFLVNMETTLLPNQGFTSTNTSSLAIEHESFFLQEVEGGTKITYRNEVEIKPTILKILARLLIGKPALLYWEFAYINRLKKLATELR